MYRLLYKLSNIGKLRAQGYMPIPAWMKRVFSKYPLQKKIITYSRLMKGQRAFNGVPQEVGCANSVTGILEMVDPTFFGGDYTIDRIDSTIVLTQVMESSDRFKELKINFPINGSVVMNTTGTGNFENGHTGIYDNGRVWNNNSLTGKWIDSYSLPEWIAYFEEKGGMKTRYFFPLSDN